MKSKPKLTIAKLFGQKESTNVTSLIFGRAGAVKPAKAKPAVSSWPGKGKR